MKKTLCLILFCLVVFSGKNLYAQQGFKEALDNFHNTLAFTYHPMVDDSNFTPIRKRSGELAAAAANVEKSLDAKKARNEKLEAGVEQLAEQCKALDEVIQKGATDDIIRTRLSAIHTKFHELEALSED